MDPITISLLASGVGSLVGGIGAAGKAKEAARRQNINALLGAGDTRFSPFVQGQSKKLDETDPGPGLLGGALGGAVAGFQQGQKLKGANLFSKGNQDITDALKIKTDIGGLAGRKPLSLVDSNKYAVKPMEPFNPNAYSSQSFYAGL